MEKILSIIIPTYNMEKYLRKCLDSLIVSEENMQRLEVLVINDGSKDLSSQIAHEYEIKFPNTFHVVDKENGNYGSCINRGLKEATGKYIKVLDADDYFDNKVFEGYISYLLDIDCDLIINDFCVVNERDTIVETYTFPLPINDKFSVGEMQEGTIIWLWHHGMAYRTQILRDMHYYQTEGISYTDDEWIFKPITYVRDVRYYPNYLYLYLIGRQGQTFDPKVFCKSLSNMKVVLMSLIDFYSNIKERNNNNYLYTKLRCRLVALYASQICKYFSESFNDELIDLDNSLRVSIPDLYSDLDEISDRFSIRYIHKWRNSGYKRNRIIILLHKLKEVQNFVTNKNLAYKMPSKYKRLT